MSDAEVIVTREVVREGGGVRERVKPIEQPSVSNN